MFKIICSLEKIQLKKYDAGVGGDSLVVYKDCQICALPGSIFSSDSLPDQPYEAVINNFNFVGVPRITTKPGSLGKDKYKKLYEYVDSYGAEDLKYVSLAGFHFGIEGPARPNAPAHFVHFFESIIVEGSSPLAISDSDQVLGAHTLFLNRIFFTVEQPITVAQSTLFLVDEQHGTWVLDNNFVSYLLGHRGALGCLPIENFPDTHLDALNYHKYMKETVFKNINSALKLSNLCDIGGAYVNLIDASSTLEQGDDIKSICSGLGGKMISHYERLTDVCKEKPKAVISGNEALKITCANFRETLVFDDDGILKGLAFEYNATITIGGALSEEGASE